MSSYGAQHGAGQAGAAQHGGDAQHTGPQRHAAPAPTLRPVPPRASPALVEPSRTEQAPPAPPSTARSLFNIMTGGRNRRVAVSDPEPQRAEPSFPVHGAVAAPRQEPADEGLDIPTFLRRQKS